MVWFLPDNVMIKLKPIGLCDDLCFPDLEPSSDCSETVNMDYLMKNSEPVGKKLWKPGWLKIHQWEMDGH